MTTLAPDDLAIAAEIAQLLRLDSPARLYMLLDLRCLLENGGVVTPADWQTAYGKAADFQTVKNAREVLEVSS